jgi:hypothetical protein
MATMDKDEKSEWEIMASWSSDLENYLTRAGKRKTAAQVGEELNKMLERDNEKMRKMKEEREEEERKEKEALGDQYEKELELQKMKLQKEKDRERALFGTEDESGKRDTENILPEDSEEDIYFVIRNSVFHWMALRGIETNYVPYRSLRDVTPECWYSKEDDLRTLTTDELVTKQL